MIRKMIFYSAAALLTGTAVAAEQPDMSAAVFGARESVESISLSPDGMRLAYVAPMAGQGSALYTVDLATGESRITTSVDGAKQRFNGCNFVSNQRFVCTVYVLQEYDGEILPVSRVIAFDTEGKNLKVLSQRDSFYQKYSNLWGGGVIDWLPDESEAILMGRQYIPEQRKNTRLEKKDDGFGVARIDTQTGAERSVEPPKRNAEEYITDGRGRVRIMGVRLPAGASGMMGETISYFYRTKTSDEWQPLGNYNSLTKEGFNPYAIDWNLDVVYGPEKTNGLQALYRVALDGSLRKALVFAHPDVDVSGVIQIGRRGRPVGVSFATERNEAVYFDPDLEALARSLSKALPSLPLIRFVDSSIDEQMLLIWAGSDIDPGRYYTYDKKSRHLAEIMLARPQLEGVTLAHVRAITYQSADGTAIPAYLTLPPGKESAKGIPAIVMPHGGPSARDVWGFDWLTQYFANRGYAVLQPNFRGSAGYGDEWFQKNGFQSWRTAIGDVIDAGRWLVTQEIADPAKLGVVGWSYGGYAALQSGVVAPDLFKAIVAVRLSRISTC